LNARTIAAIVLALSGSVSFPAAAHDDAPSAADMPGDSAPAEPAVTGESRAGEPADAERSEADAANDTWKVDPEQKTRLPWHGSMLLFDQSVTTQTVGLGPSYQSADPVYEWWLAFKPRYALYESHKESFALNLWMNVYLELTNSDTTTTKHEPVLGPTWLSAIYGRTLFEGDGYKTSVSVGPRLGLPTDMASRNAGQIVGLGVSAGASQRIPLRGRGAPWFSDMRFGVSTTYNHPVTRCTTRCFENVNQPGQNLGAPIEDLGNGRTTGLAQTNVATQSINQGQVGGGFFPNHSFNVALSADVQVT